MPSRRWPFSCSRAADRFLITVVISSCLAESGSTATTSPLGVLPIKLGASWETHLAAALIGALLAIALRHWDNPPPVRYSWEREEGDENTAEDTEGSAAERGEGDERP